MKFIVCKLICLPLKTQIISGSDSGTEHDHDTTKTNVDIPAQIFEILKSISTEIFVKEYTNHQVVTVIYVVPKASNIAIIFSILSKIFDLR